MGGGAAPLHVLRITTYQPHGHAQLRDARVVSDNGFGTEPGSRLDCDEDATRPASSDLHVGYRVTYISLRGGAQDSGTSCATQLGEDIDLCYAPRVCQGTP